MKLRTRGGRAGTTNSCDRSGDRSPSSLWPALWLAILLVGTKAFYLGWRAANPPSDCLEALRALAAISHADVLYAAGIGLLHRAALSVRLAAPARRLLDRSFRLACLLSALFAIVDLEVFAYFLTPLTYPLISLSGNLAAFATSVAPSLTPSFLIVGLSSLVILTRLVSVSPSLAGRASPGQRRIARRILTLAAVSWVLYGRSQLAMEWSDRIDRRIAESPHVTFLSSVVRAWAGGDGSVLLAAAEAHDLGDFFTVGERRQLPVPQGLLRNASVDIVRPVQHGKVRNVVLVVLESVSARWLELYGSPYQATPTLSEEARHAMVFRNHYSTAGRSADALASILLSIQPRLSYRSFTADFPRLPGETLAEELKKRGYRTAFLTSSDLGWENWRGFLADRGFDSIVEASDLRCGDPLTSWGVEDSCLMDGMVHWIADDPHTPFFAMAWTVQTHHPYEPTPGRPQIDFFGASRPVDDYDFGRYLNTLYETDRQLGRLFASLRQRHLDDETLVVVVGDHGEAFGAPHEAYGHGTALYEENVHVPMLLWSPRLFPRGGRSPIVGSHVDLNQTIVDVLGIPPASSWQGRSLFDPAHGSRAYFFVANDDYQMGMREDRWKYILDVTNGREQLYDLGADHDEQRNVASTHPEVCKRLRRRLAARAEVDRRFKTFSDSL